MNYDHIVFGLGNPGPRYAFTRHNIGFICLDVLAQDFGARFESAGLGKKINAQTCDVTFKDKKILLVKPLTFMNLSGETLAQLYGNAAHLRERPLTVIHDEVDLDFGTIRVKMGGSDAGHNGLKSIRACLGHGDYFRIRVGVGRPEADSGMELKDFVLQNFSKNDETLLLKIVARCSETLEAVACETLTRAQAIASLPL